jgi:aquaporin Z
MRKYVVEFIGTFFLVFTVCTAVETGAALAPVAIGGVLAAMIFAGGHISGGHYNPAVTLAVFLRGRISMIDAAWYAGVQIVAGVVAALACRFVIVAKPEAAPAVEGRALAAAIVVEILFTFALAYTVLNVATSKSHPNNSFYGLAIGLVVLAGATAVGSISGGAFNPAVGLGVIVAGLATWSMLWIYLVATLLGGAIAGYVFRYLNPDDIDKPAHNSAPKKVPAGRRAS